MRERENEQPGMVEQMRQTFGVFHLVCAALCAPVAAMTTWPGTIGKKFMGLPMFVGAVAMLLVVGLVPPQPREEIPREKQALILVGLFAVCLIVHRVAMTLNPGAADAVHSMSTGRPVWPGNELAAKGVCIPAVMLFVGAILVIPMPGLGWWLILASVAQAVCVEIYKRGVEAQVRAMRDARIDQQVVIDKFRERERR